MKYYATLLLIIIFIFNVGGGIANSLLGAAWPAISGDLAIPITYQSVILIAFFIGTVFGTALSSKIIATYKSYLPSIGGSVLIVVAILLFSISRSFVLMTIFYSFLGFGIGSIQALLNGYITINYSNSAINWLHSCFGIGCSISPLLIAYFLRTRNSWSLGFQATTLIEAVLLIIIIVSFPLWKVHGPVLPPRKKDKRNAITSSEQEKTLSILDLLKITGSKSILLNSFIFCACESVIMFWSTSYLVVIKDLTDDAAAAMMTVFYGSQVVGRILAGFVVIKISDTLLIRICQILALISGVLMVFVPIQMFPVVLGLIGLTTGPIFPNLVHEVPSIVGTENAQGVIGLMLATGSMANILIPLLISVLTNTFSFSIFPICFIVPIAASMVFKFYQDKVIRKKIGNNYSPIQAEG